MEINKQLFEDILSGKLKGTFKLKNGFNVRSNRLFDSSSTNSYIYALKGFSTSFTVLGKSSSAGYDIIDFIPDTNMKENELTIEIPDGKIIDWDESKKQNKVVLKDKQLTYEDICKKLFKDNVYYTNVNGGITPGVISRHIADPNNATTEHQLECILAKNKLANVAKYLNDGWNPSKTCLGHFDAWVLFMTPDKNYVGCVNIINCTSNSNILFKSKELGQQAIEILGEETVKLALEPLGI